MHTKPTQLIPFFGGRPGAAALLGVSLLMAPSAWADVIFTDTFEGTTLGQPPTGWSENGAQITVETAGQSPSGTGNRGVRFSTPGAESSPFLRRTFSQGTNLEPLQVRFDFMFLDNGANGSTNPNFQLRGTGSTGPGINLNLKQFNDDGPYYQDGSGFKALDPVPATNPAIDPSVWYRFTVTADPSNTGSDAYSVRIQNLSGATSLDRTFTGLGFQNNLTSFTEVRFSYNAPSTVANDTFFIDNVELISVPEPGSLLLLGLGLGAMFCFRRKRVSR